VWLTWLSFITIHVLCIITIHVLCIVTTPMTLRYVFVTENSHPISSLWCDPNPKQWQIHGQDGCHTFCVRPGRPPEPCMYCKITGKIGGNGKQIKSWASGLYPGPLVTSRFQNLGSATWPKVYKRFFAVLSSNCCFIQTPQNKCNQTCWTSILTQQVRIFYGSGTVAYTALTSPVLDGLAGSRRTRHAAVSSGRTSWPPA